MHKRRWTTFIIAACLICFGLSLTGCEPLRKKFTRKKKEKSVEPEFIPVLEPIDYPEPMVSPEAQYNHFYSLWKVWYKDMMESFDEQDNERRTKFLFDQAITQMQEMRKFVKEEKQAEFDGYLNEFVAIRQELDKPEGMQNKVSITNRLTRAEKKFRNACTPNIMKDSLVK